MSDATDVLQAVDQLRRDLSGYHGQLKAHNDLQRHCDHQRERIAELEAIHARDKAENAKLREGLADAPKCETCEAMLDCDECLRADGSHKERRRLSAENAKLREERDNYKALWDHATVTDCELRRVRAAWKEDREKNAKLRELARELWAYAEQELVCDENCPYGASCDWMEPTVVCVFKRRMRELGVEVDE